MALKGIPMFERFAPSVRPLLVSAVLACAGLILPGCTRDDGLRPDGNGNGSGSEVPKNPGDGGDVGAPRDSARIFFSGHSLLDNPLPDFVETISVSRGKSVNWNQQNGIGSPLRVRTWGNGNWAGYRTGKNRVGQNMDVLEELRSPKTLGPGERYDTLVVTDRHDIPSVLQWENTVGYLRHFHDRVAAANPDAVTYFYATWLGIDKSAPTGFIEYERAAIGAWECAASKVNLTLEAEGRTDRVVSLPGSTALAALVEKLQADEVPGIGGTIPQRLSAIFSDDVHLTPLGAHFMAAVQFGAIYRSSPVGAPGPSGANAETVAALQTIAWDFVRAYYAQPHPGRRDMAECRALMQDLCPRFAERVGQPQSAANCQRHFAATSPQQNPNPFVWPDPSFQPLPAP